MIRKKVTELKSDIPGISAKAAWWKKTGYRKIYNLLRPGIELPGNVRNSEDLIKLIKSYGFNNIEFGNYVTEEDRYNYLVAFYIAIYDMNKVLGFQKNMGLDSMITVGFGSRGIGGSLAHYNPSTRFININRYDKSPDRHKPAAFIATGGIRSFAHEYGHALDYIMGGNIERNIACFPLSMGRSTSRNWNFTQFRTPMRKLMNKLIHRYIWEDFDKGVFTSSYKKIANSSDYFRRHNEIFARLFEKYIYWKLQERQVKNLALTKAKYDGPVYATDQDMKKLIPIMDELVSEMKKHVTSKYQKPAASSAKIAAATQGKLF